MAAENAAPAVQPGRPSGSNAAHYAKSAFISFVSLYAITSVVNFILDKEDPIACGPNVNDNQWLERRYESLRFFDPKSAVHSTQYVPMRDGTNLAVDTYIARYLVENTETIPAVIHYTRHGRGYGMDFPFTFLGQHEQSFVNPRTKLYVDRFVSTGYAWVVAEVRGSGVSEGVKKHDFSDEEVKDAYDLIEWIVQQPWSNGEVAVFGHGFEGVGALLMVASRHPAIKAVTLNGVPVDVFDGAILPGGVPNQRSINDFTDFTHATDRQSRWNGIPTLKPKLMMKYLGGTVYPVDSDVAKLRKIADLHAQNPNLTTALRNVRFRDDKLEGVGVPASSLDALRLLGDIAASGVAVHSLSGYYDLAIARSSILLHQYLTNTLDPDMAALLPPLPANASEHAHKHRLTLGPWSHAGVDNADPFAQAKQKCFWHLDEVNRFIDYHMYTKQRQDYTKMDEESPVHFFSLVHGKWKTAESWPPAYIGEQLFYFGPEGSASELNAQSGEVSLPLSASASLEIASRWNMIGTMFGVRPYYYLDRRELANSFITFTTPELPLMEMTGEAELRLFFSVDQPNVNLVAYLEDVDDTPPFKNEYKRAGMTYITEALLNPIHKTVRPDSSVHSYLKKDGREIKPNTVYEAVLKFTPVSYILKRNHQFRVIIGAAPTVEFGTPENAATKLTVHFGGDYPTSLKIPMHRGLYMSNIVPVPKDDEFEQAAAAAEADRATSSSAPDADEFAEVEPAEKKDEKDEL